jgi:hypothetical protein
MERTRGMKLSTDERDDLKKEEFGKRAKGYRLKLLGDPTKVDEMLSNLGEESPEDRKLLETLIWKEMVENLPANQEILAHLDLMQHLPQSRTKGHALGELRSLFKGGMKTSAEDRKKLVTREKKKLAAMGISGTAVIPKIPKDMEPSQELLSTVAKWQTQLLEGTGN